MHFLRTFLPFLAVFRRLFKDYFPQSQKVSTKPIHLFSTLNFLLQGTHEIPKRVGIVFLYRPGRVVWNFQLCAMSLGLVQTFFIGYCSPFGAMGTSTISKLALRQWWTTLYNYVRYPYVHPFSFNAWIGKIESKKETFFSFS